MGDAAITRTSILHLPQDLQAQCLKHLSATERVTSARVCRAWRRLVFESSLLWDRMELWLATSRAGGTGRFHVLLKQLRRMGETTTELELLLGPLCYASLSPSWKSFDLQQLLAAFPRLRTLRLIQTPPAHPGGCAYRAPAPGLSLAKLSTLCQSCTGLVELGLNPVCVRDYSLAAVVACLERLPHLRCLLMAIDHGHSEQLAESLESLSSLTGLKQLRCAVHPRFLERAVEPDMAILRLVNLQALELIGVRWLPDRGSGEGLSLPPGLTRLATLAPSWEILLPKLSPLHLRSLSAKLEKDSVCDLGAHACLTQLTHLSLGTVAWRNDHGGGLVLPQVQRLTLGWVGGQVLPPVVDWTSLGRLTYLCLNLYFASHGADKGIDLWRRLATLKTLVLQGSKFDTRAMRFPGGLTGLQLEFCDQDHLPVHLADATGLSSLVLLGCPNIKRRDAAFRDSVSGLRSLGAFHWCLYSEQATCMGDRLPRTLEARQEWAAGVEREVRRLMPWLGHGACTVSFERDWDRDGSGRPRACLRRPGDPDDLCSQLRMY